MIPQLFVAAYLIAIAAGFAVTAWRAPSIRLNGPQVRRACIYAVAGALGEAVTLWLGGWWSHG